MVLSASIPQELIDTIVFAVHDTDDSSLRHESLQQCSLVSRSFLAPSRQWLFHHVTLDTVGKCRGIHGVLKASQSEIAPLIKSLFIDPEYPSHPLQDDSARFGDPRSINARRWALNEETLPHVLSMLSHLQTFKIDQRAGSLDWTINFTPETQTAILGLFKLPSLTSISLFSIDHLPADAFINSVGLKELIISSCDFQRTKDLPVCVPPNADSILRTLELLEIEYHNICSHMSLNGPRLIDALTHSTSSFVFSNLRELALFGEVRELLGIASWAIRAASKTLDFLIWDFSTTVTTAFHPWSEHYKLTTIDLSITQNLRSILLFTEFTARYNDREEIQWAVHALQVVRSLENLTIIISTPYAYNFLQHRLYNSDTWKKFDDCALRDTNNCTLTLVFEVGHADVEQEAQLMMQSEMPLLHAAGRLVVSVVGPPKARSVFDTVRRSISSRLR